MKLENQVTSLEISKRLKELGVKQEGNYSWLVASDGERLMTNPVRSAYKYFDQYIAFTVAELEELLPVSITMNGETYWYETNKTARNYRCGYCTDASGCWGLNQNGGTYAMGESGNMTDSRGKMLIYLLENKNNLLTHYQNQVTYNV